MTGKKLVNKERGRLSWSLSNFQAHIKLHYKQETGAPVNKQQQELEQKQKSVKQLHGTDNMATSSTSTVDNASNSEGMECNRDSNATALQHIDISDESLESEVVGARKSIKRKHNVIAEDDEFSGEELSGVLTGQNTPDPCESMP